MVDSPRFNRLPKRQVVDRAALYFRALKAMGYVAVNVGSHEMALGVSKLKKLSRRHRMPVISANIRDSKTGKLAFTGEVVRQVGSLRMCFIGLVAATPEAYGELYMKQGLDVIPPVKAAKRAVKRLSGKRCDMIVALSQLHRAEVDQLADKVPAIDAVLGSTAQGLTTNIERLGSTYFGDTYNKGKYVGELLITPGKNKKRFAVANLRGSLKAERVSLAQRVRDLTEQFKEADRPGGAVTLTPESRRILEQRLAGLRAKLQRVTMDLEGSDKGPGDASLIALHLHPLGNDVKDEPKTLKRVTKYKKKWKVGPPGH